MLEEDNSVKGRKKLRTRALSMVLAIAMCISLLSGMGITLSVAGTETGDTYVYIPVKDLSNAARYEGSTIAENFVDTSLGGTADCGNKTLLLQNTTDLVEYDFDLDDSVTNAVLKVHAKHAVVSVKAAGGAFVTLTAKNGGAADRGVNLFDLTEADALAADDNTFTVRIGMGGQAVVLNGLTVVAQQPELSGTYTLDILGESYLQTVADVSAGATRYFLNGVTPTIYLHTNEYVTFYIDYGNTIDGVQFAYTNAGQALTAEVSPDGSTWTAIASGAKVEDVIRFASGNRFYVRFTASNGDSFLSGLTLTPTNLVYIDAGESLYLPLSNVSTASKYGGSGVASDFNDTYNGGTTVTNKTLLLQNAGDYVEYNLDMTDTVTSAAMKLYITGGKVEVKPQGGSYTTLTAKNGTGNRNVAIYELTEENALAADSKKFTLRISFDGSTVILNALLLQTQSPELTDAYNLELLGESYLQNVVDVSANASRYFDGGTIPTLQLPANSSVTFYFDYSDDAASIAYDYTNLGAALTAEVSTDGSAWNALSATSGKIGDAVALSDSNTFYLRFTAAAGESYLKTLTLTPTMVSFADVGDGVYLPLNALSAASKYSGSGVYENYNDTFNGGSNVSNPTLLLQQSGDYVEYNFDMTDTVTSAALKLYATGGKVEVKPQGGAYIALTANNGVSTDRGVSIYELSEANALSGSSKKFTLRISHAGSTVILRSLLLQSKDTEVGNSYTMDLMGESYLQNLVDISSTTSRYYLNGNQPAVHLHNGEHVTFFFDVTDEADGVKLVYTNAGADLTAEVSPDGSAWTAITSGSQVENVITLAVDNTFYTRFTAASGDSFFSGLSLTAKAPTYLDAGTGLYLPLNSLADTNKYSGTGIAENFNDTHMGGTDATNATMLLQNAGDYVEYNFDMDDSVTTAKLKLYITGGKVEVKPYGGSYTTLTAENGTGFNRNVAIYQLDATNALSADSKKFTLRISQNGSTVVLNSLLLQVEIPEVTTAYTLDPLGESYLRNVTDVSAGATRYFLNGNQPTIYLHTAEHVTFFFDSLDDADGVKLTYSSAGAALTAQVSLDGSIWFQVTSGAQMEEVLRLAETKQFYVRFTAAAGDAFLSELAVTPTYDLVEEKDYLYLPISDLSNATRFGGNTIVPNFEDTALAGNGDLINNPTLLLQSSGDYVEYNINLPDDVAEATLKLYMKHGVVSVKPKGGSFTTLTAANGAGFDRNVAVYELTTSNALASQDRQFTVRIGCDGTNAVVINSLMVQTKITELADAYTLDILGESFPRNLETISQGATRYFANEKDATIYLHTGESATFSFDFADTVESLVYGYGCLGQPITAELSSDGSNWVSLPAGGRIEDVLEFNEGRSFYVRFSALMGDSFLQSLTITPAEPEEEVEADYVYVPIRDLSNTASYAGSGIVENFVDTYSGGESDQVDNKTLLLEDAGDYVEYNFNLSDTVTSAKLKVYMTDAVVSVKPEGGRYITLAAENGSSFNRGVAIYNLNANNALTADSNKFTVRIANNGSATAVLNGLVVDTGSTTMEDTYTLDPLGESYLQGVWAQSGNNSRYFHEGSIPTIHIHDGDETIFRMNFEPGGVCYLAEYETLGAEATVEVSLDGTNWVEMKGRRVEKLLDMSETGTFYIRFATDNGEIFLMNLLASREEEEPPVEKNTNPKAVADVDYVFFQTGTSAEEKYMFGLGEDWKDYFESTHDGMGYDGHEGGYSTSLPYNARMFNGKYIEYEFDLEDSIEAANLKVYGVAGMEFLVSVNDGDIYEKLTTSYAPTGSGRGYYIFALNEKNALAEENNKFRLKIQGAYGALMSLMIESGAPAVASGTHFTIDNANSLRYVVESSGLRTYYADKAFANYYLDGKGTVMFRVPVSAASATLYATYCGDLEIAVANSRNGHYTIILNSQLGTTGTPHTNTFDLSSFLNQGSTLYILVKGHGSGAFLDSMGISITPYNTKSGSFSTFTGSEANYLYSVTNNAQGIGTAKRVTVGLSKARGIDVGGSVVYKINLPDDATGVDVTVKADGEFEMTASLDGEDFISIVQTGKKKDAIRVIEPLPESENKVLYLKIANTSASKDLILHGLSFTTEGVPNYERPETSDFDYAKALPNSFPTVEKLEKPAGPDAIYASGTADVVEEESVDIWMYLAAGGGLLALLLLIIILLVSRKKKDKENKA